MKQARDYRKYNVRLTSADWQRGSGRVIKRFTSRIFASRVMGMHLMTGVNFEELYSLIAAI